MKRLLSITNRSKPPAQAEVLKGSSIDKAKPARPCFSHMLYVSPRYHRKTTHQCVRKALTNVVRASYFKHCHSRRDRGNEVTMTSARHLLVFSSYPPLAIAELNRSFSHRLFVVIADSFEQRARLTASSECEQTSDFPRLRL